MKILRICTGFFLSLEYHNIFIEDKSELVTLTQKRLLTKTNKGYVQNKRNRFRKT